MSKISPGSLPLFVQMSDFLCRKALNMQSPLAPRFPNERKTQSP